MFALIRSPRPAGLVPTLTGVAAAFGLSASGLVVGAMLARLLDTVDAYPDPYAPWATVVFAVVGVTGAGATVAEVAGRRAPWSIGIAGVLVFGALIEIMRSVETTGAEGVDVHYVLGFSAAFTALLAAGAWLRMRRLGLSRSQRRDRAPRAARE